MVSNMFKFGSLVYVVLIFNKVLPQEIQNKICVDNSYADSCTNIRRNQTYECSYTITKTDCFLNIDQGISQLALVYPEQALIAAPLVSDKVVVVATVAAANPPYQTAVIVHKSIEGGFQNLQGKRFCHPGYKHNELVSKYVLDELESKILSETSSSYCDVSDNITVAEKRIRALSTFFNSSCKPGIWTEDDELDKKWKSKYSNLCDLCGSQKCETIYQVPFNDTLTCITQNNGDIALTTLRDAQVFFNTSNVTAEFRYLCPNGTLSDAQNPCTWTQQLDRMIITGKDFEDTARNFISAHLASQIGEFMLQSLPLSLSEPLKQVLAIENSDRIILHNPATSLKTYIENSRGIPDVASNIQCNTTVKWCTINNEEHQKCLWLQQASLTAGLQPIVDCVRPTNETESCLTTIQYGGADIAFNDVNYGYSALQKGLTVVAYPETDNRQLSSIVIVVQSNNTNIRNLSDLKGKSGCFPEYGGKEWLAFIDAMRRNKIMPSGCDYDELFIDFIGNSCVPGAISENHPDHIRDKLCDRCVGNVSSARITAKYCDADNGNQYYSSDGALKCLLAGQDYAVITVNDVNFNDSTMFRVLSKDGKLMESTGFNNLGEDVPLTIITAGEVVAKSDSTKKSDIVLFLRDIEVQFGQSLRKTFKVFEEFNKTKDLIFPDSTPGLTFDGSEMNKYVENFKTLLRNAEKCSTDPNSLASFTIPSTVLIFIGFLLLRF